MADLEEGCVVLPGVEGVRISKVLFALKSGRSSSRSRPVGKGQVRRIAWDVLMMVEGLWSSKKGIRLGSGCQAGSRKRPKRVDGPPGEMGLE